MSDESKVTQKRSAQRPAKIADRVIDLTHEDPLERLKQFCSQGQYRFHFKWDKFANGIMCELEITYQLGHPETPKRLLVKEARFVGGEDIEHAKKVVAAVLLERLGLGVQPTEEENADDEISEKMQEMAAKSLDFTMTALNGMFSSMANSGSEKH